MNQETFTTVDQKQTGGSHLFNTRKVFTMMLRNWYIYILGIALAGGGAYMFLKHKIPTYSVETLILIGEEDPSPGQDLLEGFSVRPGIQNLDNQVSIVSSYSVIRQAVEELPFEVDVYRKGLLSEGSYYPMSPIRVEPGPNDWPYNSEFVFRYRENDMFHLKAETPDGPALDTLMSFGQVVNYMNGSFQILAQPELEEVYKSGDRIFIRFYDKDNLTKRYLETLLVENISRDGSILKLSLEGTNRVKDVIFLNKLTEVYIKDNLDKKNLEARRVIDFIDALLVDVSDSLLLTETQLQDFRSRNRIMDVSAQAQQIIDQGVVLDNEKARLTLAGNYYAYLEEYLSSDDNDKTPISPSSMGIEDPNLANLMQELAGLQAQYFSNSVGERNPMQAQLELRIRNTKLGIKETLSSIMLANRMAKDENQQQINRLNSEASGLPIKERQLLGFERKFNLNNVLYTFLMTRSAEAQIQSASNSPDNELIDPARATELTSPNKMLAILIAITLAIGLPTFVIIIKELVHNRITSDEDLSFLTKLPVIANFPHSRLSYNTVVLTEPGSKIAESFRSLRTYMGFFTQNIECPVILVTSSVSGEGKTFAAINLASAYSLTGKKVILIGFDLRRPSLYKSFKLDGEWGITSYLIGEKTINQVIYKSDYDGLDILPSGPIPPNPGELSSMGKAVDMVKYLKGKYDYVIIDSPPIGVVSDIYSVASIADSILMMVRHDYTKKNILASTLTEMQNVGLKSPSILVNDVKSRGQSYRYAYKYKYDYSPQNSKKSKSRFFKNKNKPEAS